MYDQMALNKSFSNVLANGASGAGNPFELSILDAAVKAGEYWEIVQGYVYIRK